MEEMLSKKNAQRPPQQKGAALRPARARAPPSRCAVYPFPVASHAERCNHRLHSRSLPLMALIIDV